MTPTGIKLGGISFLQHLLSLAPQPSEAPDIARDAVIVAIHFNRHDFDTDLQLGLAILDTRCLNRSLTDASKGYHISTSNITTGPLPPWRNITCGFLFGETTVIPRSVVSFYLRERFKSLTELGRRKIVLVSHDVQYDLQCLDSIDFELPTSVVSIIDTKEIAAELSPSDYSQCEFEALSVSLQCPFVNLDGAGNKANFILRVLLLLSVKGEIHKDTNGIQRKKLLEKIARLPLPTAPIISEPMTSIISEQGERKQRRRSLEKLIPEDGLKILQETLGIGSQINKSDDMRDLQVVAVDFENLETIRSGFTTHTECQVGVALFDARAAFSLSSSSASSIKTYNFVTGAIEYGIKAARKFLFGETKRISPGDITNYLNRLVTRKKDIIIVGHDINNDLTCLQALGFDCETSVVAILDTQKIAVQTSIFPGAALGELLKELDCPFANLHSAGNDAHFALRALLLLATRCSDYTTDENPSERLRKTQILARIAREKLPKILHPLKWTKSDKRKYENKKKKWYHAGVKKNTATWIETHANSRLTRAMLKVVGKKNDTKDSVDRLSKMSC